MWTYTELFIRYQITQKCCTRPDLKGRGATGLINYHFYELQLQASLLIDKAHTHTHTHTHTTMGYSISVLVYWRGLEQKRNSRTKPKETIFFIWRSPWLWIFHLSEYEQYVSSSSTVIRDQQTFLSVWAELFSAVAFSWMQPLWHIFITTLLRSFEDFIQLALIAVLFAMSADQAA